MALALLGKRRKAIELRKKGFPYSEIKARLCVSKSSLSYWLRNVELAEPQLKIITANWVARRVETYRQTVRQRTKDLENRNLVEARSSLATITDRDLRIAGLFLYLGEGTKVDRWTVCIANSDPEVIRFATCWLVRIMGVPKEKIRIKIHVYHDMDVAKEAKFWSQVTSIPIGQFRKPHIKASLFSSVDYKTHGHGTCNVIADNGPLKQRIMAEIQTVLASINEGP